MAYLLTLLLLLGIGKPEADAQDTIFWKANRPLDWADFSGEPRTSALYEMLSSTGIKYTYRQKKQSLQFEVTAFFIPSRSWKKYISDSTLIKHEQLHFDITELFARRLLKAFKQIDSSQPDLHNTIVRTAAKLISEKNLFQEQYDTETRYGTAKRAQRKWETAVKNMLANLQ